MKKILIIFTCTITALCIMSASFAEWQKEVTIKANVTVKKKENKLDDQGEVTKQEESRSQGE